MQTPTIAEVQVGEEQPPPSEFEQHASLSAHPGCAVTNTVGSGLDSRVFQRSSMLDTNSSQFDSFSCGFFVCLKFLWLATGDRLGAPPSFSLRRPPKLRQIYLWHLTDHQAITGKVHGGDAEIVLRQYENGIHWKVAAQHQARKDASKLMKRLGGIIFEANARIHDYPWYVPKAKANRQVVQFLKQLPKKELRSAASPHLDQVVEKWIKKATQDEWVQGLQSQSPKQLWEHRNMIMTFQVWAIYRLATGQLRLHYSGAAWGSSCPQDSRCDSSGLSNAHITWPCYRTQTFWKRCLDHWTG
ncbi:hypothetical protein PC116_g7468 [Phytophthora cactorum]|uniref:Uncharacterized protein n=1 Tax=Phytophthora cactorum TaxID=29920 RepID=A0A8T1D7Q8_9STRA|nr:hypothetical protein PC115_g4921 [Phytophthora cactorum]KAG3031534.1 hypothetical protein PC119_g5926 [Phytophthora cactorum]KAG4244696.1 hypothetical protein PC116_g7468 [Phytophthora cactorum]